MSIASFNSKFVVSAILVFFVCYGSTNKLPKNLKLSQTTDQPINLDHTPFFIFGDSWLDFGNNNYFYTPSFNVERYPYGETYPGYATGRYSDGRNIADNIISYANLPLILPYLHPRAQESYIYGVSFASAGAGALIDTYQGQAIPYLTQVAYFTKVADYLTKKLNSSEDAEKLLSKGVYLVFIGNNDYTNAPADHIDPNYVDMVVGNTTIGVEEIYNRGGRNFLFINMPPLGCAPGPRQLLGSNDTCYQPYQDYSILHNQVLERKLPILQQQLDGFNYVLFDYFTKLTSMINDPSKYGLTVSNKACCGFGPYRGNPSCGIPAGPAGPGYELCDDPNEYVYWDPFHLTENAYRVVSVDVWDAIKDFFQPSSSMA